MLMKTFTINSMEQNKQQTAVEWFISKLPTRYKNAIMNDCKDEIMQAKEMVKEREHELKQLWFGRGIVAAKEDKISELKPKRE